MGELIIVVEQTPPSCLGALGDCHLLTVDVYCFSSAVSLADISYLRGWHQLSARLPLPPYGPVTNRLPEVTGAVASSLVTICLKGCLDLSRGMRRAICPAVTRWMMSDDQPSTRFTADIILDGTSYLPRWHHLSAGMTPAISKIAKYKRWACQLPTGICSQHLRFVHVNVSIFAFKAPLTRVEIHADSTVLSTTYNCWITWIVEQS